MSGIFGAVGGSYFYAADTGGLTRTGMPIKSGRPQRPDDIIPVPVRTVVEKRGLFGRRTSQQEVKVLFMTRDLYLRKYAKDDNGNYVGSESPAEDAGIAKVDYFHSPPPEYEEGGQAGSRCREDGMRLFEEAWRPYDPGNELPSYESSRRQVQGGDRQRSEEEEGRR